ncbi:murein biosynthesis integral membrane protein MurJ [candidate division WWE3 bacterium]|nr:murein biosynthesis integral membrane protein MurJ [candidate division WWE3 bacterium]
MVKKILRKSVQNGSNILFQKQKTILSGAFVIAIMLFASAILGLIRKRLYASVITPGPELDVFFAAFRLPDLVFQFLIGGSLNAAFIPIFSSFIAKHDREKTWEFVSSILNISAILFSIMAVIFYVFARPFAILIGPGFNAGQIDLLVDLMRILLLAPILLGISSFVAGTLQSFKRFFLPFFSPVIYNLGAILGIVLFYPAFGMKGAAWGVVIGAAGHFLIQLPALYHIGFKYSPKVHFKDVYLMKMLKLSLPRTIGSGIEQIKSVILVNLASFLQPGSISFFDLGQSIANVPLSILGYSLAQASFPQFAALYAKNDLVNLRKTFSSSFNQIMFFIMPISVFLVVLKIPVVRLIYGTGDFSWQDTVLTSWVVALFGVGIFAQALNSLMFRLCYALHETKLPLVLAFVSMGVSLVSAGAILFIFKWWDVRALAFAVTMGSLVEFVLLLGALVRRELIEPKTFLITPIKILMSSLLMVVIVYLPVQILDEVFIDTKRVVNLIILVWLVSSLGITTYLFMNWIFGVPELKVVFKILLKMKDFRAGVERFARSTQLVSTNILNDTSEKE